MEVLSQCTGEKKVHLNPWEISTFEFNVGRQETMARHRDNVGEQFPLLLKVTEKVH